MEFIAGQPPYGEMVTDQFMVTGTDDGQQYIIGSETLDAANQLNFQESESNMPHQETKVKPLGVSVVTSAPIIIHPTVTESRVKVTTKVVTTTTKKPRAPRKKKDPNAPAGVSSAYQIFFKDTAASVKSHNPAAKFGDISKIVASMWEALSDNEKSVYKKRNEEDKIRHTRELEAYKAGIPLTPKIHEMVDEATKEVFSSTDSTTDVSAQVAKVVQPEDMTANICIEEGCSQLAVRSPEWEDEYCSNECAVQHCKNVFRMWVSQQQRGSS